MGVLVSIHAQGDLRFLGYTVGYVHVFSSHRSTGNSLYLAREPRQGGHNCDQTSSGKHASMKSRLARSGASDDLRSGRRIFCKALSFGPCAAGSDWPEIVAMHILAVVQRNPRRQSGTQTLDLVGTLLLEAEGVEEFVIHCLDDLTYPGDPPPQTLGPGLFRVALGRMDYLRPVVIEPATMVFSAFEAFE